MNKFEDQKFTDEITIGDIRKINYLEEGLEYKKLLLFIEDNVLSSPKPISFEFDYETAKMLLDQAEKYNLDFSKQLEKKIDFIIRCKDLNVRKKLLEELKLDKKDLVTIIDSEEYYYVCNLLSINKDDLRELRNEYISEIINDENTFQRLLDHSELIGNSKSFYYYNVVENNSSDAYHLDSKEVKENMATRAYLDLISHYFFNDRYVNVYKNINQMIEYMYNSNFEYMMENRDFYFGFCNIVVNNDIDEIRNFFAKYKNSFTPEIYKESLKKAYESSFKNLVDGTTSFTEKSPLYNDELSNKYGCDIYYLDGEDFHAFVRTTEEIKKTDNKELTREQISRLGNSFTYIGTENITTFLDPKINLTMIYKNIGYSDIEHVCSHDSGSSQYGTELVNELHTPKSLLQNTNFYPEIFIRNLSDIQPEALLCYDEVTDWDINFAKKFKLPIVVINTKKYMRKNEFKQESNFYY